ncbi:hypothetical protein M5K25_010945 [Dendrobium thyrsiflorum]|uniref:Reverse transcriptase zinc-binding domain-containing protein n=1 Tax=Dendrobium thyrsiflorum TaxID=117978 RepID=A0ABD0V8T9_DENTH
MCWLLGSCSWAVALLGCSRGFMVVVCLGCCLLLFPVCSVVVLPTDVLCPFGCCWLVFPWLILASVCLLSVGLPVAISVPIGCCLSGGSLILRFNEFPLLFPCVGCSVPVLGLLLSWAIPVALWWLFASLQLLPIALPCLFCCCSSRGYFVSVRLLSVGLPVADSGLDDNAKVEDLIVDGCWREDVFLELFGSILSELIRGVHIFQELEEDKSELLFSTLAKSVTNEAFRGQFNTVHERFNWLKDVKLLPREYLFWWRIIHNAIPTQEWLVHRGLEVSNMCIWGCLAKEDIHHIMYDCKVSLEVFDLLKGLGFSYSMYSRANEKKHGKSWATPTMVAAFVLGNFNMVNLSILWKQWDTTRLYPICLSWCPPPSKWLKLNIDGAFRNPYTVGVGVVVRDSAGKKVLNEEILGAMGIIIEGDNQSTLKWLQKNVQMGKWNCNSLDFDLSFIRDFHHVIFNYMPRRFNRAADFCARLALGSSFLWREEQDFNSLGVFLNILQEDAFRPP